MIKSQEKNIENAFSSREFPKKHFSRKMYGFIRSVKKNNNGGTD